MSYISEPEMDCDLCGRSFSSYAMLEMHYDEEHGPAMCRRCKREPVYEAGLCYPCSYYGH